MDVIEILESKMVSSDPERVSFHELEAIFVACQPLFYLQTALESALKPALHRLLPILKHCCRVTKMARDGKETEVLIDGRIYVGYQLTRNICKVILECLRNIYIQGFRIVGWILYPRPRSISCVTNTQTRDAFRKEG